MTTIRALLRQVLVVVGAVRRSQHELATAIGRLVTESAEHSRLLGELKSTTQQILAGLPHPQHQPNGGTIHMLITDSQQVTYAVTLGPDAAGNVGEETAPLVWTVDDPTVLVATVSADGLTATLAAGVLGTSGAHVDVPLADGSVQSLAVDPITVHAGLPTSASISAGVVEDKPPVVPPV